MYEVRGSCAANSAGSPAARACSASCMRCAALPVGAASAMRSAGCSSIRQAITPTTVVVLPVPGPPLTIVKRPPSATTAATRCQSISPSRGGAK